MTFDSYKLLLNGSSKDLLISFGSRGQSKVSKSNYLRDVEINQMHWFDRDGYSWYEEGVRGVSDNIFDFAEHVRKLCDQYNFNKIYCIGASMGGYAALAVGALIKADKVIAISPQVVLNPKWPLAPSKEINVRLKNMGDLISQANTTEFVVIASSELVDVYHVSEIYDCLNLNYSILNSPHNILGMFKNSCYLEDFLNNILSFSNIREIGVPSLDLNFPYIKQYLSDFLFLYFEQKYEESLPLIKKIVLLSPEWIDAKKMLAQVLFNMKSYHDAYSLLRELNIKEPGNIDILNKLIFCLSINKRIGYNFYVFLDELLLFSCLDSKVSEESVLLKVANWATKEGNHRLSECVRKILIDQYNMEDYANYYQLGRSYQVLKNISLAINCYKKVLTLKGRISQKDLWIYDKAIERMSALELN